MAAITNFGTLKAAVLAALAGNAPDADLGLAVQLAESWINTELPLRLTITEDTPSGTPSSRQIALPADWLEPVSLFLTTFGVQTELKLRATGMFAYGTTNGTPTKWCINGANIDLDVPCDVAHTFRRVYWQKSVIDQSDDANTVSLLTNYPDLYLFATLTEVYAQSESPDQTAFWGSRRNNRKDEILQQQARNLAGNATLSVDNALKVRGGFNIISGDTQ